MGKGLALLGVPILSGKKVLIVTSFTQSLGAELLTNGDFSAWTGDNPNGWTVLGESGGDPEVTERDPGQTHADTKTVGGAANLYSTAGSVAISKSSVISLAKWHEFGGEITARASGSLFFSNNNGIDVVNLTAITRHRFIRRNNGVGVHWKIEKAGAGDLTIDDVFLKRITLNVQQTMLANAIVDFTYALPASPAAGDRIMVLYRISNADLEVGYNCWQAYLQRDATNAAWDFRLDSVNAGTATNRINVTGVGSPTTIRVICDGTKHNCYTLEGTTWTKRGSEVDVSWNDSATGINTIYCSGTTPTKLTATPL